MFTQASFNAHIRHFANRLSVPLLPLLACTLLVGLALGPVETARAQTDVEPTMPKVVFEDAPKPGTYVFGITSAPWRTHFGEYAAEVLQGADPEAQLAALQDLIVLASSSEGSIDLSETLTPLVQLVDQGISKDHSLMALQALHVIGTEHSIEPRYRQAMEKLYRTEHEDFSGEVRQAAAGVLVDFYGTGEQEQ